jgi:ankyrin repeat protein
VTVHASPSRCAHQDEDGASPLHTAAEYGCAEAVRALLSAGAQVGG